jgi:nitroreductase
MTDHKKMTTLAKKDLATLLTARYGHGPEVLDVLNPTLETLFQHKSVRSFTDKPLAPNTAELLVAAAQSASTSSNLQTWSVVAVEDQGRKDRLAAMAGNQKWISACPLFLVWVADLARLKELGEEHQLAHESLNYLEMLMMATIDASLAAQNAATAAESLDLGIVYIGGIRNKPLEVAKELGLPPMSFATFGMCVGNIDPEATAKNVVKPRLPQRAVLHKEHYDVQAKNETVVAYNATMEKFYAEQGMKPLGPWHIQSLNRVRGPDAMAGRDLLVDALKQLGFDMK